MDYRIIIGLFILAIFVFILLKIIKSIFILFFGILIAAMLVLGILIFLDYKDFKNNFQNSPNLFLTIDEGEFSGGFIIQNNISYLNKDDITKIQNNFQAKNYKDILDNNYKVFIIELKSFEKIDIENKSMIFQYLRNEIPLENEKYPYIDNVQTNGFILSLLYANAIKKQGPIFLLDEFKAKNLIVYPETIMFKCVKYIPNITYEKVKSMIVK